MIDAPKLFCTSDLFSVLRAREQSFEGHVAALSVDQIQALPEEKILEHLSAKMLIEPIVLLNDELMMDTRETKIDVSRDPTVD